MNIPGFLRTKFGYTKKETATLVVDGQNIKVERVDHWLPQGLRVGSLVTLNESWFLVNQALGGSAPTPPLTGKISAISSIVIGESSLNPIKLIRAYMADSDTFIQFTMQLTEVVTAPVLPSAYKLIEVHLFQTVFTDYPDDWEPVLGPDGLGQLIFTDNDGHEFTRVTGNGDYSKPENATENGIFDPAGQTGWVTDLNYHLYERQLNPDTTESLLIQVEEMREQNGKPGDSAVVTYSVGIGLPTSISFIPTT